MFVPKTREEAKQYRYNWTHDVPYDRAYCAAVVDDIEGTWLDSKQCGRKPGHGTDGIFCKQHARKEK